jgi:hypothetical protein
MQTPFERFLFIYSAVTAFWWIFLYPHSTYRNPFMGIISLSIIIAILLKKLYDTVEVKKPIAVKYVSAIAVLIFMFHGFSANLIYAYIGYNDGVQFDLDGNVNREFYPVSIDNSQKEFHATLRNTVMQTDTLYNASFVTVCYVNNPVANFEKLKESLQASNGQKYVLITRDLYPLGSEKGYKILDSLNLSRKLIIKNGGFELYSVWK